MLTDDASVQKLSDPATWKPGGYEIRDEFLIPVLNHLPPRPQTEIELKAQHVFEERPEAIGRALAGEVQLLGRRHWYVVGEPVDWLFAPEGDWQWTCHLNSHYFLFPVAFAYRHTGNRVYSDHLVSALLDWMKRFPLGSSELSWEASDWSRRELEPHISGTASEGFIPGFVDGPWTSLGASARVGYWLEFMQIIQDSPSLTNDVLARLIVSMMRDHRLIMTQFPRQMNQYQATSIGLVRLGLYFPYLAGAHETFELGWSRLERHTRREIYPDGSLAECSPNYGMKMLIELQDTLAKSEKANRIAPPFVRDRLSKAVDYMVHIADPLLWSPRIAKGGEDLRETLSALLRHLEVPGASARLSANEEVLETMNRARLFPWAGHFVARSDWSEQADWIFFEPGPRGSGHADAACLGVQLMSEGRWLIADPGFYSYSTSGEAGRMSRYLRSSAAHSVVLVDGQGQRFAAPGVERGPNLAPGDYDLTKTPNVVSVRGHYGDGFGEGENPIRVSHERAVVWRESGRCIEIQDTFREEDRLDLEVSRCIEWHWQLGPEVVAKLADGCLQARVEGVGMHLEVESAFPITMELREGECEPYAGWFSSGYGGLVPAPMLIAKTSAVLPMTLTTRIQIETVPEDRDFHSTSK